MQSFARRLKVKSVKLTKPLADEQERLFIAFPKSLVWAFVRISELSKMIARV